MGDIIDFEPRFDVVVYQEGVYEDMPFPEYNELGAVRSHDLTAIMKDPYAYKYEEKPDSEASFFVEGRLQHCLFLEPHVFDDEFIIAPKINKRTKAGKEEYEDFVATAGDRSVIPVHEALNNQSRALAIINRQLSTLMLLGTLAWLKWIAFSS